MPGWQMTTRHSFPRLGPNSRVITEKGSFPTRRMAGSNQKLAACRRARRRKCNVDLSISNHNSCFAHVDSFLRMKRTSFRPGWRRQSAGQKVYTTTRKHLSFPAGRSSLCLFFSLTTPVCHHSSRQRQKERAGGSVTS